MKRGWVALTLGVAGSLTHLGGCASLLGIEAESYDGGPAGDGADGSDGAPTSDSSGSGSGGKSSSGGGSGSGSGSSSGSGAPSLCAELPEAGNMNIGTSQKGSIPCDGDFDTDASAACPTRSSGFCSTTGTCGGCGDCTAAPGHPGPACSRFEGLCGVACTSFDAGCAPGEFCDALGSGQGACIPKHVSGDDPGPAAGFSGIPCAAQGSIACTAGTAYATGSECTCGQADVTACDAASQCAANVCGADGLCGAPLGALCAGGSSCRSGGCNGDCACVPSCTTDSNCGNALSGVVCSTDPNLARCIAGCRGNEGNGCPYGSTCTSTTTAIGTCVPGG